MGMLSSAKSLSLLSSGNTTFARSGLSFLFISAHTKASLAKRKACSIGQSSTAGSSISAKVPFSIALSTW
ncbi:hypothetical protein VIGAN_01038700 [Vigna angularis var. angularis]|uniref:Uncharacterized protein n=1 Tax=Vigna angularis var. angularis TaxID=157739 RepID=A0A0S3QX73_PHAAN|nr:hypothetical protein VIGAN_01038700 [Vigna angularis var. angularis]